MMDGVELYPYSLPQKTGQTNQTNSWKPSPLLPLFLGRKKKKIKLATIISKPVLRKKNLSKSKMIHIIGLTKMYNNF